MRIALLQLNPTVGDLDGNAAEIAKGVYRAEESRVKLVVTFSLAVGKDRETC